MFPSDIILKFNQKLELNVICKKYFSWNIKKKNRSDHYTRHESYLCKTVFVHWNDKILYQFTPEWMTDSDTFNNKACARANRRRTSKIVQFFSRRTFVLSIDRLHINRDEIEMKQMFSHFLFIKETERRDTHFEIYCFVGAGASSSKSTPTPRVYIRIIYIVLYTVNAIKFKTAIHIHEMPARLRA